MARVQDEGGAGREDVDDDEVLLALALDIEDSRQQSAGGPDDLERKIKPWIESGMRSESWGNARAMRTLLERAREAQAVRIAADPASDVSRIDLMDIQAAMEER